MDSFVRKGSLRSSDAAFGSRPTACGKIVQPEKYLAGRFDDDLKRWAERRSHLWPSDPDRVGHRAEWRMVCLERALARSRGGAAAICRGLPPHRGRDARGGREQSAMGLARQLGRCAEYPLEPDGKLFPGRDYCAWLAISAYGPLTPRTVDGLESFREEIDHVYPRLTKLAPNKPIIVAEFGCDIHHPKVNAASWARAALQDLFSGRWPAVSAFAGGTRAGKTMISRRTTRI